MSQHEKEAKEVVENIKNSAKNVADHAHDAAGNVLEAAKHAVQEASEDLQESAQDGVHAIRRTASEAIDEAGRHLRDAENEYNRQLIDDLARRAQDLAERSINFWADSSHRARRQFQTAADATTRYVSEQPGRSILIAAAAGAAIATAFFMGSRSRKK
jgi:ElaB/YqjD/DUF883 family membrane-anchored ribosome-binding protein